MWEQRANNWRRRGEWLLAPDTPPPAPRAGWGVGKTLPWLETPPPPPPSLPPLATSLLS